MLAANPAFDPVRPVLFATVRRCEHDDSVHRDPVPAPGHVSRAHAARGDASGCKTGLLQAEANHNRIGMACEQDLAPVAPPCRPFEARPGVAPRVLRSARQHRDELAERARARRPSGWAIHA
jgi:hypothetical protein